jgi:hypothetical protein
MPAPGPKRAPRPPANRYEYAAPGDPVHLDIKQLGRFWQVGKRILASQGVNECLAFTATAIAEYATRGTPISGS